MQSERLLAYFYHPTDIKKIFRRHLKALASRYRTSPSHCQISLPCAYPCSSVAFLGITHPCLCISARLISLPGHASPSRFRAFPCNPYPSHCVAFLYVFVAAPHFDLHRFPFANPGIASRFHTPAVQCHAIPFQCIAPRHVAFPLQRPATLFTVPLLRASELLLSMPLHGYSLLN